jgi:hypothetical protein
MDASTKTSASISARIIRADGKVEDLGVIWTTKRWPRWKQLLYKLLRKPVPRFGRVGK